MLTTCSNGMWPQHVGCDSVSWAVTEPSWFRDSLTDTCTSTITRIPGCISIPIITIQIYLRWNADKISLTVQLSHRVSQHIHSSISYLGLVEAFCGLNCLDRWWWQLAQNVGICIEWCTELFYFNTAPDYKPAHVSCSLLQIVHKDCSIVWFCHSVWRLVSWWKVVDRLRRMMWWEQIPFHDQCVNSCQRSVTPVLGTPRLELRCSRTIKPSSCQWIFFQ